MFRCPSSLSLAWLRMFADASQRKSSSTLEDNLSHVSKTATEVQDAGPRVDA